MSARMEQYIQKRIRTLLREGVSESEIVMRLRVYASMKEIYGMLEEVKGDF